MSYEPNKAKKDIIDRRGVTVGLPLFEQGAKGIEHGKEKTTRFAPSTMRIPDWIWNGTRIKAEIYHKLLSKFQDDAIEYLETMIALGGSATDSEVVDYFNDLYKWAASTVSARRNYWIGSPYYVIESYPNQKRLNERTGVQNTIWFVKFNNLKLLIELREV